MQTARLGGKYSSSFFTTRNETFARAVKSSTFVRRVTARDVRVVTHVYCRDDKQLKLHRVSKSASDIHPHTACIKCCSRQQLLSNNILVPKCCNPRIANIFRVLVEIPQFNKGLENALVFSRRDENRLSRGNNFIVSCNENF